MLGKLQCSLGFHDMYRTDQLRGVGSPQKCRRCGHSVKGVDWDRGVLPETNTGTPMPKCKPPLKENKQ